MQMDKLINFFKVKEEIDLNKPIFECKENRAKKVLKVICINFVSLGLFILIWFLLSLYVNNIRGVPFPTPQDTFRQFYDFVFLGEKIYMMTIWDHFFDSIWRWVRGYTIAVILGIFIGFALGSSKILHDIIMPIVIILQLIPGLAWIPIALLLFGLSDSSTIFMIAMMGVTPIIINTSSGIQSTPKIYVRAAQMMGASRIRIFFQVMLPSSILPIINGLRIGLANAWRVLVAAEMIVGTGVGLGYIIIEARWSLNFTAAFVCIMIICIVGLIIEKFIFVVIEKWAMNMMGFTKGD